MFLLSYRQNFQMVAVNFIILHIIDKKEKNDIGFFFGRNCETSVSSKSICKIIDEDAVKVIDNHEKYNIGLIIRFKILEPLSLF